MITNKYENNILYLLNSVNSKMDFHTCITPCCNEIDCRDVLAILSAVGFPLVCSSKTSRLTAGAMNATFGVRHEDLELVLKVSTRPRQFLFPNKLVVDHFASDPRVSSKLPQMLSRLMRCWSCGGRRARSCSTT